MTAKQFYVVSETFDEIFKILLQFILELRRSWAVNVQDIIEF